MVKIIHNASSKDSTIQLTDYFITNFLTSWLVTSVAVKKKYSERAFKEEKICKVARTTVLTFKGASHYNKTSCVKTNVKYMRIFISKMCIK